MRSRATARKAGVVVPLPWSAPPLTGNRTRGNPYARAKEVDDAKTAAVTAIRAARIRPVERAEITLHFRPATWHRRDADGMFPTLKVAQDALVICGALTHDDSMRYVPAATCRIHPPNGEPAAMWLELQPIEETA